MQLSWPQWLARSARLAAMRSGLVSLCTAAALSIAGAPALAGPLADTGEFQRNGALSRHVWSPDLVRKDLGGLRLSAGLALGLHDAVHAQMQRNVAPAFSLELGQDSRVSLLPGGRRGAMLVLHSTR